MNYIQYCASLLTSAYFILISYQQALTRIMLFVYFLKRSSVHLGLWIISSITVDLTGKTWHLLVYATCSWCGIPQIELYNDNIEPKKLTFQNITIIGYF